MNIDEFIDSIEFLTTKFLLKSEVLARTYNAVKIRVILSENIFIQFYFNQESKTYNYVLVGWNRRLYGRDCVGGDWHRHPFEDPSLHDTSKEGGKEPTPLEFLEEVWKILHENGLL